MPSPLTRVLDWLRAGYPDGVPATDVVPLLALLTRTLRPEEVEQIASTVIRENPDGDFGPADVRGVIERLKDDAVTSADVRKVAARLASVGWPLSDTPDPTTPEQPAPAADLPASPAGTAPNAPGAVPAPSPAGSVPAPDGLAQRILAWLTAGYPEGIPPTDRVPLMALLERRLTDAEVAEIAERLVGNAHGDGIQRADAGSLITRYTDELPSDTDLSRVASELAAKGWPLAPRR